MAGHHDVPFWMVVQPRYGCRTHESCWCDSVFDVEPPLSACFSRAVHGLQQKPVVLLVEQIWRWLDCNASCAFRMEECNAHIVSSYEAPSALITSTLSCGTRHNCSVHPQKRWSACEGIISGPLIQFLGDKS